MHLRDVLFSLVIARIKGQKGSDSLISEGRAYRVPKVRLGTLSAKANTDEGKAGSDASLMRLGVVSPLDHLVGSSSLPLLNAPALSVPRMAAKVSSFIHSGQIIEVDFREFSGATLQKKLHVLTRRSRERIRLLQLLCHFGKEACQSLILQLTSSQCVDKSSDDRFMYRSDIKNAEVELHWNFLWRRRGCAYRTSVTVGEECGAILHRCLCNEGRAKQHSKR